MATQAIEAHRWTREEYERMVEKGVLGPEDKVELLDGIIYDMTPQGGLHATVIGKTQEALRSILPPGFFIRSQMPLAIDPDSEPEPDLAVVPGELDDYVEDHPRTALLVVEVADSSLGADLRRKKPIYARAGIPEYWLFKARKGILEVNTVPVDGLYTSRRILRLGDTVSPGFASGASIPVRNLFPKYFQEKP